ncbi:unnamed protein product, partial [Vitis vinifera]
MDEEAKLIEKQGIVSILGSDCERTKAASLRRTLSWDMSSRKWLAQHGFSHMRKIASSQQFIVSAADSSSSSEGEDEYEEGKEVERPGGFQTWSSILTQKGGEESGKSGTLPLPYVHPLVKRSSSSLSEKSLQVCTESLESSSLGKQELTVVERPDNYYSVRKRLQPPSSFPPPLPSLSPTQGPNVRFHTHRQNGRLVLEAVSVPTQNCFQAQRHGGRLVLTFANIPFNHEDTSEKEQDEEEEEEAAEELGQEFENFEEENEIQMNEDENGEAASEEGEVVKVGKANEFNQEMEAAPKLPSGMINVHRSALMMKKLMGLVNRNPTWPPKLNKAANLEEATPLPPPPRVARIITTPPAATAASSFNAYDYCWRSKPPTGTAILNPPSIPLKNNSDKFFLSKSSKAQEQQQLILLRGNKAEYSVPLLRGCKEPRRSLMILTVLYKILSAFAVRALLLNKILASSLTWWTVLSVPLHYIMGGCCLFLFFCLW